MKMRAVLMVIVSIMLLGGCIVPASNSRPWLLTTPEPATQQNTPLP